MLYTLSIPTDRRLIIKNLVNAQYDCCHNYHSWLKVYINSSEYVLVGFAHGNIDNRAVFVHLNDNHNHYLAMPLMHDEQLLAHFAKVGQRLQNFELVWLSVLVVYLYTKATYTPKHDWVFAHLKDLDAKFPHDCLMWLYLAILHLAMISEEFYTRPTKHGIKGSVLGKRMKFVGLYQTLRLHWRASDAAIFSRQEPSDFIEKYFSKYWLADQQDSKVKGVTNEYFRKLFM